MSTDAIVLLKEDHKRLRRLFREFEENAGSGIVERILESLIAHIYLETACMYPTVRRLLPDLEYEIQELSERNRATNLLCAELVVMHPSDIHYAPKAALLVEAVSRHIDELETSWFPKVREGIGRKKMQEIGSWLIQLREKAPRKPASLAGRGFVMTQAATN